MKLVPVLTCSALLAASVAMAGMTAVANAKTLSSGDQALLTSGKALFASNHCDACHGADLKGRGPTPGLLPGGQMSHYTRASFIKLMTTGVGASGSKIAPPMVGLCNLKDHDSEAIYVYLTNQ